MGEHIDLAEYLFRRLYQAGVRAVHGVPGDYNLTALDYVVPAGLDWVGNCNELNAGYAADGYGRIKGISALVTTFGVGELSAINAIACAYTEMSPVVHIVGTPSRMFQAKGTKLHHSLCTGDPSDYNVFADMTTRITVARENLTDPSTAASQIDRAIRECVIQSRPVYLQLPTDMVAAKIPAASLSNPLDLTFPSNDPDMEVLVADRILQKIYASKQPFLLVDGGASRYGVAKEANELARVSGFPTSTTPFGKSIINETLPNFHGVYATVGKNVYSSWVQSCDLVLHIGPHGGNINTYGFSTTPSPDVAVTFDRETVTVGDVGNEPMKWNLHVKGLVRRILDRLDRSQLPKYSQYPDLPNPRQDFAALPAAQPADPLTQDTFWERMSDFFRPGDIIMTETGTASTGGREFVLPENATLINSSIWLSIGFMLGAAQGASLAQRDLIRSGQPEARTILFEGDGSFQMTAQELSTVIRKRLDLIIFLINNNGYTIERLIHGMKAEYNDVAAWRYLDSPSYFGAPTDGSYNVQTARATTWGELNEILAEDKFKSGGGLRIVELMMETEDAPETLKILTRGAVKSYSATQN